MNADAGLWAAAAAAVVIGWCAAAISLLLYAARASDDGYPGRAWAAMLALVALICLTVGLLAAASTDPEPIPPGTPAGQL